MTSVNTYIIQKSNFIDFISSLAKDFKTFYLKSDKTRFNWKEGQRKLLYWQEYKGDFEGLTLGEVRAQDPLKQFVFSSKERVSQDYQGLEAERKKPLLLIGAKNCDLKGLEVTDFVFMQGDFQDPFYKVKRESMFIIASDCSNPTETCFCTALDLKPFPQKNYDMGVCDIGDSYLVDVASQRAAEFVSQHQDKFKPASDSHLNKRENLRNNTINNVDKNVQKNEVPKKAQLDGVMDKGFESDIWKDEVKTCVECGCCNTICPTCHCFFLGDTKEENKNIRYKIWDACLYKDFAVVAGGANPRKHLFQRLRNRYEKKFDFFPSVAGMVACTGCGRCISGCPAKIDIRRILKNLVKVKA